MLWWEFCEISKNTFFIEHLWWLLLSIQHGHICMLKFACHKLSSSKTFYSSQKIWCTLVSCTMRAPNIFCSSTKYLAPTLNILELKLFEFISIIIWNTTRRISLFNLPYVLESERVKKFCSLRLSSIYYLTFASCTNKA